jgi:hypothetical protein
VSDIPFDYRGPPNDRQFYAVCLGEGCSWEDPSYHASADDCVRVCPECGADVDVFED